MNEDPDSLTRRVDDLDKRVTEHEDWSKKAKGEMDNKIDSIALDPEAELLDAVRITLRAVMWDRDDEVGYLAYNVTKGVIVDVNERLQAISGYHESELIGQPVEMLVPTAKRPAHVDHTKGYTRNPKRRGMGQQMDIALQKKDGSEVSVDIILNYRQLPSGLYVVAKVTLAEPQ